MEKVAHIIIPDNGKSLIRLELSLAFLQLGFKVSRPHPGHLHMPNQPDYLPRLLQNKLPTLFFSINFQGLEHITRTLELLAEVKAQAAVWCVDNPWNLLSGVREKAWQQLPLFVTDASFIPTLLANKAHSAKLLPLAASPLCLQSGVSSSGPLPTHLAPFVFVGRSAFPHKEEFFAGCSLDPTLWKKAMQMLTVGERPDLIWWEHALDTDTSALWPGKKARLPSLGAENTSLAWRRMCLHAAATYGRTLNNQTNAPSLYGLDIFGDSGWQELLPDGAQLHPPLDYYAHLPRLYKKARYSLTLTSLQLPHSLNQRHFDIWAAGGFCLTDATKGLDLFPQELTAPVTFQSSNHFAQLVDQLESHPHLRLELQQAWQRHILQHHTYTHRAKHIIQALLR